MEPENTVTLKISLELRFQCCYGFEMQLADYLKENGIKRNVFAARIGVSPQTITGWCKGSFWIAKDKAQAVYDLTGGQVTPTDLMLAGNEIAEAAQ